MFARVTVLFALFIVGVKNEFLTKKLCHGVDRTHCEVHNVVMDACPEGPAFCSVRRNKHYTLTADLTPHFAARKLKLAMYADDTGNGTFAKPVKSPTDACERLYCPMEAGVRRIFDVDFVLGKNIGVAKFPLKMQLWNEDDESQACCFTFNVKIIK